MTQCDQVRRDLPGISALRRRPPRAAPPRPAPPPRAAPRPAPGGIIAGSSPSIHSTDLRISAAFFSQSAGTDGGGERSAERPADSVLRSTVSLLLARHLSKSHGKSKLLVQVRVERPNWMSSQSRHASWSLAP